MWYFSNTIILESRNNCNTDNCNTDNCNTDYIIISCTPVYRYSCNTDYQLIAYLLYLLYPTHSDTL